MAETMANKNRFFTYRKIILFIFSLILIMSYSCRQTLADDILSNGSFEVIDGNLPKDWSVDVWSKHGKTGFYVEHENTHTGNNYITIENNDEDDAKLVQSINVKPNTVYLISCWVKTYDIGENAKGANISVIGTVDTSEDITGTSEQWEQLELYGKTGEKQNKMQVAVRIGGYGSLNTGKASFDDFSVEEVKDVPSNIKVVNFFNNTFDAPKATANAEIGGVSSRTLIAGLFSFAVLIVIYLFFKDREEKLYVSIDKNREKLLLALILSIGLVLRIIIGMWNKGHEIDMNCFKAWANLAATKGLSNFYISNVFSDYPPGYIYVLYFIGKLQKLFSLDWNSHALILLIKMPAITADIVCSYLIYKCCRERAGKMISLILCGFYALNPAIIINSALWGQIDGFFTMFLAVMILFVIKDRLLEASLIFTLSFLIKPQALIFTPILIFAFIKKKDIKLLGTSVVSSILLFIAIILPFSTKQNIFWIIDKYKTTLSSYPYASLNAFNLYSLIGGNWELDTNKLFFMQYSTWGMLFTIIIVIFGAYVFLKSKHRWILSYIAFFTITAVFMLSTKMHERYIFPALILCLLWYILSLDNRAIKLFLGYSITSFINVAYVFIYAEKGTYQLSKSNGVMMLVSLANIILFIWTIYIGFQYTIDSSGSSYEKNENMEVFKSKSKDYIKAKPKRLVKKDFILMFSLTFIYSVIAFVDLGTTKVPQSFWKPAEVGENFCIDLGTTKDIGSISYYIGLGEGNYSVSFSTDKIAWYGNEMLTENNIYNWNSLNLTVSARYVKIEVTKPGGMLNEVGIFGKNSSKAFEIKGISDEYTSTEDNGKPVNAIDEQKYVESKPSYLTGMIFDEIYHARTAYETLHRIEPYEWTHPPLGKIFISLGVFAFGMNPFGWRVIGTLFGIAMIPAIYMLGKRLFKSTKYAFLAAFLMTFDFMHFTQTRIATVDVFPVFFIILMYYFMYRFTEADIYNKGFSKSITPLALSGIFFGLGAASKWISFYSAVGLAIIFFKEIYDRYMLYKQACNELSSNSFETHTEDYAICMNIKSKFSAYTIKTLGIAVIFFIIIPFAIYIMSYIPFMLVPGRGHGLIDVFKYQEYMYKYHSTLVATHPFESPWYQWPIIVKPIWYYGGQAALPAGKISSIVAMGNPAIWWVGAVAFLSVPIIGIRKKDKTAFFIVIGGLSQYLPWVLITRLTFIYHYFASVPFIMFSIVYVFAHLYEKNKKYIYHIYVYMIIVIVLFIMFYPVISGMVVDKSYAEHFLRWFKTWYFYS